MDNDELEENLKNINTENNIEININKWNLSDRDILGQDLHDNNMESICQFIKTNKDSIVSINLSGANLNDKRLEVLCEALKECPNIKNIDFSDNKITNVEPLKQVLENNKDLNLNLSNNYIEDTKPIAKNLNSIEQLNMGGNLITNIKPISNAMQKNNTTKILNFEDNGINAKQANIFSDSINNCKTIQEVDFSTNFINPRVDSEGYETEIIQTPKVQQFYNNGEWQNKQIHGSNKKEFSAMEDNDQSKKDFEEKKRDSAIAQLDNIEEMLLTVQENLNPEKHEDIPGKVADLIKKVQEIKVENKDKPLKNFDLGKIDEFKNSFNGAYDEMMKHDDLKQKFGGKNSIKDWFNKKLDQIKDMCIGKLGVTLDSRTKDKLNLISDKLNKFKPPKGQSAHSTPPNPNKTQDQGHKL